MRLVQRLSPIRAFEPVVLECDDIPMRYRVDIAQGTLVETTEAPHLSMHSESLWFLFQNSFGFDTLAVNGCLEEMQEGGFTRAAKSLSIETLNNLGFRFAPGLILEPRVVAVFLKRLLAVKKRLQRTT